MTDRHRSRWQARVDPELSRRLEDLRADHPGLWASKTALVHDLLRRGLADLVRSGLAPRERPPEDRTPAARQDGGRSTDANRPPWLRPSSPVRDPSRDAEAAIAARVREKIWGAGAPAEDPRSVYGDLQDELQLALVYQVAEDEGVRISRDRAIRILRRALGVEDERVP